MLSPLFIYFYIGIFFWHLILGRWALGFGKGFCVIDCQLIVSKSQINGHCKTFLTSRCCSQLANLDRNTLMTVFITISGLIQLARSVKTSNGSSSIGGHLQKCLCVILHSIKSSQVLVCLSALPLPLSGSI